MNKGKTKKNKSKKEAIVKKVSKQPTKNFTKFFNLLIKEIEDLNLTSTPFKDVHGGFRLQKKDLVVADCRIAIYGIRLFLGRDGLSKPVRIENSDDIKRVANMLRAFVDGISEKDGDTVYHYESFSTESKKDYVDFLLKKEF